MATKEALELIEKINTLYSGALSQLTMLYTETMNQLIMITVSVLAIVGVIIPALVSWLQSRQINREQKLLKTEIDNQIQIALQELRTQHALETAKKSMEIQALLDESKQNFAKELERIETGSSAKTLHLQAQHFLTNKVYAEAATCAFSAMTLYVGCSDESNLRRVSIVAKSALEKIDSKTFQDRVDLEQQIESAIKAISSINSNGRYEDLIDEIRENSKAAKAR